MIEKQRLEELIKQNVIIYTSRFKKPEKYKLYKDYFIDNDKLCTCNKSHTAIECVIKLDNLFEIKEDAEFAIRFKRIPKTEFLDLPTWEEFKNQEKQIRFFSYPFNYACYTDLINIGITEYYNMGGKKIFEKPLTKKNYLKACEICRKLWLGEKYEK